jgi:hypothetical protein
VPVPRVDRISLFVPERQTRAREIENPPNKLLEAQDGKRLDTGATAATSGANQTLETVGALDGTAD